MAQDLTMTQGSTYRATLTWTVNGQPKDMTDWYLHMQVRKKYADEDTIGPVIDIDSDQLGGLSHNGAGGVIQIEVSAEVLSGVTKGQYVYDMEYTPLDGKPMKALRGGKVMVNPEVTRDV